MYGSRSTTNATGGSARRAPRITFAALSGVRRIRLSFSPGHLAE